MKKLKIIPNKGQGSSLIKQSPSWNGWGRFSGHKAIKQFTSSCRPYPNRPLNTWNSFAGLHCIDAMGGKALFLCPSLFYSVRFKVCLHVLLYSTQVTLAFLVIFRHSHSVNQRVTWVLTPERGVSHQKNNSDPSGSRNRSY